MKQVHSFASRHSANDMTYSMLAIHIWRGEFQVKLLVIYS